MIKKIRHIVQLVLFLVLSFEGATQTDISISPIWSINTPADEIFCTFIGDNIIITSNKNEVIVDDVHRYTGNFALFEAIEKSQAYQYEIVNEFLSKRVFEDVGTAYYDSNDQTVWFSTAYNFNKGKGTTLKIYSMKKTKRGWKKIKSFKFNSEFYSVTHPWMNEDGTQLFFSSNMEGGAGGMDIWFCNKLNKNKWSDPIWAGAVINSSANEVFPTIHKGDIYYSSNIISENGLDIYRAFRSEQWEKKERLRNPINTTGDDFQMVFRDDQSGFLTSRRENGQGGDDIYFFRIKSDPKIKYELKFQLVFKDTPLQNIQMLFTDEEDVILKDFHTDEIGIIPVGDLELKDLKKIYALDVDDKILRKCILYLLDKDGNRIRSFRFGDDGYFKFEYLPLDMLGEIAELDETDYSLLTLDIEGQAYNKKPGDIDKGEPVFVTNSNGDILALAYTTDHGNFNINEIAPLKNYYFRFDEESNINYINILDIDGTQTLEVKDGVAFYHRIIEEKSIRLIDENKVPIYINEKEVFVIRDFFYEFESSELNETAKGQLNNLAVIMRNNPSIKLELSSHTDSRGTTAFNLNLSNERAKKAVDYLFSIGVSKSRMTSLGHGEYELINDCADEIDCSEEEHASNRRTEIRIYLD